MERFIRDSLVASMEAVLTQTLSEELRPLLEEALSGLAFELAVELPKPLGGDPVPIAIVTDFQAVDFGSERSNGGLFVERGGAYSDGSASDADAFAKDGDDLGAPLRRRCGLGRSAVELPKRAPIELGLHDDFLNQVLYAAWRGGWLEVEGASALLGELDLSSLEVTDFEIEAGTLQTPTVSDCHEDGTLRAHLGDLRVDGSLVLEGRPLTFTAYVILVAAVEIGIVDGEVSVGIGDLERIAVEVNIHQDDLISLETLFQTLLESTLASTLKDALGKGLLSIPLPEIDVSGAVGLPTGSVFIQIKPQSIERREGLTVIGGAL